MLALCQKQVRKPVQMICAPPPFCNPDECAIAHEASSPAAEFSTKSYPCCRGACILTKLEETMSQEHKYGIGQPHASALPVHPQWIRSP
eukprot:scaffold64808_cov15-Tisochrysis_lutea.AAC.1